MIPVLAFSDKAFEGFTGPDGPITVPSVAGEAKDPALDAGKDYSGSILRPADSSQYGPARIRHGLMKLSKFPRMSGQIRNTATGLAKSC